MDNFSGSFSNDAAPRIRIQESLDQAAKTSTSIPRSGRIKLDGPGRNHGTLQAFHNGSALKRILALCTLLVSASVVSKLAFKQGPARGVFPGGSISPSSSSAPSTSPQSDPVLEMRLRYLADATLSADDRSLVERVSQRYGHHAVLIEQTDGLPGLRLLDRLDLEAIFLFEKYPREFRRLREFVEEEAAADLLLHWREYFGLKRGDETDRGILIAELASLTPSQRLLAARYPNVLPILLADPAGVSDFLGQLGDDQTELEDILALLSLVSLEQGASDLRAALRTLENDPPTALEAFRRFGPEGFAMVALYGDVIAATGGSPPLDELLVLLRVNSDSVDELLRTHRPETVAGHLRHIAAVGLVKEVGGSPQGLRLAVEFGRRGEEALRKAGADAADVVYGEYADPLLRNQAVSALGEQGTMALVILDKYASDPSFREILRTYGAKIIPPIAQADAGPETLSLLQSKERKTFAEAIAKFALLASGESGQKVIRLIQKDGLERVSELTEGEVKFYHFLPLYDVVHLGNVVRRGHAPTSGELAWALVDGCFVVADVLCLAAVRPDGVAAAEMVRAEAKAAAREAMKSTSRQLASTGENTVRRSWPWVDPVRGSAVAAAEAEISSSRLARWWSVRSAGGIFQVFRRLPDALPRLDLAQLVAISRPMCAKAGMRMSGWRPIRLLREGTEVILQIPPQRGLKYVAAQMVQASVGVVGFYKMEEHLASRRPRRS